MSAVNRRASMDTMAIPTATAPPPEHHRAPVGRIVMTVVGALLIVIALGFGAIGTALTWAHATQRDSDGFFTSGTHRLESITAAITSEDLDLGVGPGRGDRGFDLGDVATVRLRAESADERPIFIGIGPARDVDAYLANVAHAEIDSIDFRPFRVTYNVRAGATRAAPPRSGPTGTRRSRSAPHPTTRPGSRSHIPSTFPAGWSS
jgi:hypothetical protein